MKISEHIQKLESAIKDPNKGLPDDIFLFSTRIVPSVNVDLLIRNEKGEIILAWRDDGYSPAAWHIPGGIIRYKETIRDRIKAVAAVELGAKVKHGREPIAVNQIIVPKRKNRGHFISLLYECRLTKAPDNGLKYAGAAPKPGEWAWFAECPENIIAFHGMYRKYFKGDKKNASSR